MLTALGLDYLLNRKQKLRTAYQRLKASGALLLWLFLIGIPADEARAQACTSYTVLVANYNLNNVASFSTNAGVPGFNRNLVSSGLTNPNSILLYRDTLYVASAGTSNNIKRFNTRTGAPYESGSWASGLNFPERMVIGPDGNMFVADYNSNTVKRININNGQILNSFTLTAITGQQALGIEFIGREMYLTRGTINNGTGQGGRIERYTFSNNFTTISAPTTYTTYSGATPRGITMGPDGNLYVAVFVSNATAALYNTRIERFAPGTTAPPSLFIAAMDAGSTVYQGLNWSPDGFLYVADFGEDEVQVYNSLGVEQVGRRIANGTTTLIDGPHFVQFYCPCASTAAFTPTSLTACSGAQSNLVISTTGATPQLSYAFSSPSAVFTGPTTTTATSNTISISSAVTTTFSVTVTDRIGCSATTTGSLAINPLPTVSVTPSSPTVCAGQTVGLTATSGLASYTLVNTGAVNTTGIFSVTPATTTTYTVVAVNASSCTAAATTPVTVNPVPVASISPSATAICAGQTATLTASGGTAYRWSTGATSATLAVSSSGTYSVTVTNASGCMATASSSVTVNPQPQLAVNSTTVCAGETANLTLTGCAGGTIRWSTGSTAASLAVAPLTTTTYSATCTLATSCFATTTATVTVSAAPTYETSPVVTLASCTGGRANNDARVDFPALQNTARADIVAGSRYGNGPAFGAVSNRLVTNNAVSFTNLPNPTQPQLYTVRLFNGSGSCFTDVVVTVLPAACPCGTICVVPIIRRIALNR